MSRMIFGAGGVLCLAMLLPATAWAQRTTGNTARGGTTTSGLFGSRTLGGDVSSSGNSLFGSGGQGQAAIGSSATTAEGMQAGTVTGSERFVRGNRTAANSFVGADTTEVRNISSGGDIAAQRGMQNAFNQFRQLNQFAQQFGNFNNNYNQNSRTQVRVALTLGFEPPVATGPADVTAVVGERLTRLPGVRLAGTPQVVVEGRTAVVRGTAATEQDRERVSRLLLLEPGIAAVRNEMTVAQGSAGPGSRPSSPPAAGSIEPPPRPPQS
jgi:hypothetical protein